MTGQVYYVGVDVGTSSVRAAMFDEVGNAVKTKTKDLNIYNLLPNHYEQSSAEIWECVCDMIKNVTKDVSPDKIKGIGFDATCSLVVLDENFNPLSVNGEGDIKRNVIMWMDHRAGNQADFINSTNHEVLKYVGGKISLEMQPPKLLWLKQNLPDNCWKKAAHFFDLPDFLTWKATGVCSRSICSVVCKWTFSNTKGWSESFWSQIGLSELKEDNFRKIGSDVRQLGQSVRNGISEEAAKDTNLNIGTPVGVSVIDAHCGGIGTIGCSLKDSDLQFDTTKITNRIALISGTSSCHMALSEKPLFLPGIWGPYGSVMIPEYWLNEAGQSAVASLLDHVVQSHPAYAELKKISIEKNRHMNSILNDVLHDMASKEGHDSIDIMTRNIHVWPDFHGNRSPLADPTMTGMICGLTLDKSINGLALLYLATLQALALGTVHILNTMRDGGHSFNIIFLSGGLQKNSLFTQIHSNATGLPIALSRKTDTVLLGAAILGACASGNHSLKEMMNKMSHLGKIIKPQQELQTFYKKKYEVFLRMAEFQKENKKIMMIK
uniref:FGGY carbohydrate kinase domain-containing protein-like n=1 Tax=Styela clava TaxID=7725 RepID=UPI00193A5B9C|nr:FGGY carbohydrate kinase domain-containing protein-like [Styela clava]